MTAIDRIEKSTSKAIRKEYDTAMSAAIKKSKDFLKRADDVASGKIKPPSSMKTDKQISAWKRGYLNRAMKETAVVDKMASEMAEAGIRVNQKTTEALVKIYGKAYNLVGKETGIKLESPTAKKIAIATRPDAFTKIAQNRLRDKATAAKRLRGQFAEAIARGETDAEIIARIRHVTGMEQADAQRILRTERTTMEGKGQMDAAEEIYAETGRKPWKQWICIFHNSRDTHMAMNGQRVDYDEYFYSPSGAMLMHPGDSDAPAGEICNCQCRMAVGVYGSS